MVRFIDYLTPGVEDRTGKKTQNRSNDSHDAVRYRLNVWLSFLADIYFFLTTCIQFIRTHLSSRRALCHVTAVASTGHTRVVQTGC